MAPRRIDPQTLPPDSPLAQRLTAVREATPPLEIDHDGERIVGHEGESLALTLLAAGRTTLARSGKYHRPRGPGCLRGACDGCLVRVDGVPNVMACRTPTRHGMRVTSQNAFPSAAMDVMGVTDWFFPKHMDHHHLMVGFGPAINRTMQVFARRMAGMGTLPDVPVEVTPSVVLTTDVLVVGAGMSGTTAANSLVAAGLNVLCVEEDVGPGGTVRDDPSNLGTVALSSAVSFAASASVVATYDDGTLVQRPDGIALVAARARLFANGCHDLFGAFVQNDLPGIYTVRAFGRSLCAGVLLGERVVIVGTSALALAVADAAQTAGAKVLHAEHETVREARGSRAVNAVVLVAPDGTTRTVACDALVVTGTAAAYELAGQAGAGLAWNAQRECFAPVADADGATAVRGVYVTGRLRGCADDPSARTDDGRRVANRIVRDLAEEKATP